MADTHDPTEAPFVPTPIIGRSSPQPERPPLPPDIEQQFNHLMQTVQVLSAHFLGESASPWAESGKEPTARRIKKFHRAGGNGAGDETPAESSTEITGDLPEGGSVGVARNKHIAWPRRSSPESERAAAAAPPRWWLLPAAWWPVPPAVRRWLGAAALGLLLLGGGIWIGRSIATPAVAKPGRFGRATRSLFDPAEVTEQAFITANEALHAEHAGNADAARKLYEKAVERRVDLPGTNYRLALLALQRDDRLEAEQRLERSTRDGEEVAASSYLLARIAADEGDLDEEASQFERATRARPLDGRYFFYYAEALRRQGKPRTAIAAFEHALDRPYTAPNGDLYLFKERLAKIEDGHDDAFNAELAARLKQDPLGGDWLLLAAAQDLDRQAFVAAGDHLRQAEKRLPPSIYADLTHDYFFQTHAKRSELTGLLNRVTAPVISSAGPTVLDPASWAPERADPATWPTRGSPPSR